MNVVLLILALFAEVAGTSSLKLSQGFSKRLPSLATVVFYGLSLTLLSFALTRFESLTLGLEVDGVYAVWSGVGIAFIVIIEILWKKREQRNGKDIGPIGTTARIVVGLGLAGSVVHGQLSTHLAPATWVLGLVGFPALVLAWHWWRIHRTRAPFHDLSLIHI